jgi:hypothetical protein
LPAASAVRPLARTLGSAAAGCLALLGGSALLGGCASTRSSEPVGHTTTTEKRVIDTPTEKTTVTETHDKDTRYVPR